MSAIVILIVMAFFVVIIGVNKYKIILSESIQEAPMEPIILTCFL